MKRLERLKKDFLLICSWISGSIIQLLSEINR